MVKAKTPEATQQIERSSQRSRISSSTLNQKKRPLLVRFLFHPMLYVALLAHGALLAIPGGPEEEVPPEVEEIEEITITMLPAIVEPDPEIPVEELPVEPPPAPAPEAVPPPAEPIPQQEQLSIEPAEPEAVEDPVDEDADAEDEDSDDEDGSGDEAPVDTSADLSQVANLIDGIVVQINNTRESTLQIEPTDAPTRTNFYRNPENYFVDAESKSGEFKPGILQNTENARLLVNLDDTNADELSLQVQNFLSVVFDVADVSDRLPNYNANLTSKNDVLLALSAKGETTVRIYLALAKMKGNSATVIPWASDSFPEG